MLIKIPLILVNVSVSLVVIRVILIGSWYIMWLVADVLTLQVLTTNFLQVITDQREFRYCKTSVYISIISWLWIINSWLCFVFEHRLLSSYLKRSVSRGEWNYIWFLHRKNIYAAFSLDVIRTVFYRTAITYIWPIFEYFILDPHHEIQFCGTKHPFLHQWNQSTELEFVTRILISFKITSRSFWIQKLN